MVRDYWIIYMSVKFNILNIKLMGKKSKTK